MYSEEAIAGPECMISQTAPDPASIDEPFPRGEHTARVPFDLRLFSEMTGKSSAD